MAPKLLELIELAHLRPEQVDNHVAGVKQHPVAARPALDLGAAQAAFLKRFQDMVGHRADLTGRSSGSDHHEIRDAGFAGQIDNDDIFRLVIFKLLPDQLQESLCGECRLYVDGYGLVLADCSISEYAIITIFPARYTGVSLGRAARIRVADSGCSGVWRKTQAGGLQFASRTAARSGNRQCL